MGPKNGVTKRTGAKSKRRTPDRRPKGGREARRREPRDARVITHHVALGGAQEPVIVAEIHR